MTFDATTVTLGEFVFGDDLQEAGGRPAVLVGLFSKALPDELDRRQAQLVEEQRETLGVDGVTFVGTHAAASS